MNANTGWVKIHREIQEHWIWQEKPFSRGQAFVDLVLLANHSTKKVLIGNEIEEIPRGSFVTSELKLMERWGWSKNKVRLFLKLLEKDKMLVKDSNRKRTTINIVNYGKYQICETTEEPQTDCKRTTDGPQTVHKQECKNVKNEKKGNIYTCAFESIWSAYPRKKEKAKAYKCYNARLSDGFSEDELITAVKRYADECKKNKTEEKYIKLAATFLGSNTPFVDYLGREYLADHGKPQGKSMSGLEAFLSE